MPRHSIPLRDSRSRRHPHAPPQPQALDPICWLGSLALAGGILAIATGWLPWETLGPLALNPMDSDVTSRSSDLANGYYLVGAAALAAICGLILFLANPRTSTFGVLLGIGAILGGALVLAVEAKAYSNMSPDVSAGASLGYGLYLGIAGGALAIVGGLLAVRKRA